MKFRTEDEKYTFEDLCEILKILRAPGGCPWDREQTHQSIKHNVVEEAYELVEAIDGGDGKKIADESGDMLLQVVFHAEIGAGSGEYDISDVTDAVCRKLIHRHPHVFGDVKAKDSEEVLKNWDAIKRSDRGQKTITAELRGVSANLPALMRCGKLQKKAEKAGYEIPGIGGKYTEEALGKKLFELVKLCRENGVEPEVALAGYNEAFIREFEEYEDKKNEIR